MFQAIRQWWRPTEYHVEYFRGRIGMCSDHDNKEFDILSDANCRLQQLSEMNEDEITAELGYVPTFMRILSVQSGHPLTRILNRLGRKRLWRVNLFGWKFWM